MDEDEDSSSRKRFLNPYSFNRIATCIVNLITFPGKETQPSWHSNFIKLQAKSISINISFEHYLLINFLYSLTSISCLYHKANLKHRTVFELVFKGVNSTCQAFKPFNHYYEGSEYSKLSMPLILY